MKYLFIHNNFPAQFKALATHLGQDPQNEVFFLSEFKREGLSIPGVKNGQVPVPDAPGGMRGADIPLIKCQRRAESFAVAMQELKAKGFYPDLIYFHGGWGSSLFAGEIFPKARRVNFAEWFFNSRFPYELGENLGQNLAMIAAGTVTNHQHLEALSSAHQSISPTHWQKSVHPELFHPCIAVQHEGVDTDFYQPGQEQKSLALQELGLKIPASAELVTYTSPAFEPMRGFPAFIQSLPMLLDARPEAHVAIMGNDKTLYDLSRPDRRGWLQAMLEQVPIDFSRVHILPAAGPIQYRRLLQISSLHVYLTRPYVLSWSLLEAMSCGALVLASDTPPVQEVARSGVNMFTLPAGPVAALPALPPVVDPARLAERAAELLAAGEDTRKVRAAARATVLEHYDAKKNLPEMLKLLHG